MLEDEDSPLGTNGHGRDDGDEEGGIGFDVVIATYTIFEKDSEVVRDCRKALKKAGVIGARENGRSVQGAILPSHCCCPLTSVIGAGCCPVCRLTGAVWSSTRRTR